MDQWESANTASIVNYPDNGWTRIGNGDVWAQWFGERLAIGHFSWAAPHQVVWLTSDQAAALARLVAAPMPGDA